MVQLGRAGEESELASIRHDHLLIGAHILVDRSERERRLGIDHRLPRSNLRSAVDHAEDKCLVSVGRDLGHLAHSPIQRWTGDRRLVDEPDRVCALDDGQGCVGDAERCRDLVSLRWVDGGDELLELLSVDERRT
ncbi:MAG: hypothetical protein ABMA25_18085 [Ilumatobacteraceae bacterium]